MLIDSPIDVPPPARHLHICLIHKPTITDRVTTRPGRVRKERREALHPPVHGHMIDLDPTLGQQLLDIAIRQAEPQIPTHRKHDHLRREPKALERRTRDYGNRTSMRSEHPTLSLSDPGTTNATQPCGV